MLKTCLMLLIVSSAAISQLIIDPVIPWGKVVIDQMVKAIDAHEEWAHFDVEYEKMLYTLGKGDNWDAYIIVHQKADHSKMLSCNIKLHQTFHDKDYTERKFEIGLVQCENDPQHTTTVSN